MAPPMTDFTGKRFGRLFVVGLSRIYRREGAVGNEFYWTVKCDCGTVKELESRNFYNNGHSKPTQSCGCLRREMFDSKEWKEKNRKPGTAFKIVLRQYKANAKTRGLSWQLTDEQFKNIVESPCYYTGIKPSSIKKSKSGEEYLYNGVDRVDNSKGYILDNCVSCCTAVNLMKLDMTQECFIELCKKIAERF